MSKCVCVGVWRGWDVIEVLHGPLIGVLSLDSPHKISPHEGVHKPNEEGETNSPQIGGFG